MSGQSAMTNGMSPRDGEPMAERITMIDATQVTDVPVRESSLGYIVLGLSIIVVLLGGLGAWALMAQLNGAIVASGRLTVESNRKTVQHLDGGIVRKILVKDGDVVAPGQLLVSLDSTIDQATFDATVVKLDELGARAARLIAERDGMPSIDFPEEMVARAHEPSVVKVMQGERDLFEARRSSAAGTERLLQQRVNGFDQQIVGLEGQIASKGRQVELVMEEHKSLKVLYDKGYATLTRLLALQRQAEQLEGERAAHGSDIATVKNSIAETELELGQIKHDFQEIVTAELRTVEAEIFGLQERRIAAEERLKRAGIIASHAGVVLDLAVHTVGGVITPGQPILDIVPDTDELLVEAQIATSDIDKVSLGQASVVRLSAFSQDETPEIEGTVRSVSADRLIDEVTGQPYYVARIDIAGQQLSSGGIELVPGMPAEVFIETGDRTAISYFVKPLTDRLAKTFIES
ncbi:MAG: HlyD family type I secretion periplasmic adaptor subunit [Geminicoccales bacterium]